MPCRTSSSSRVSPSIPTTGASSPTCGRRCSRSRSSPVACSSWSGGSSNHEPAIAGMVTRPRLILVVEDESSLRELIAHILLLDEHEVDTARDGVEALYRIEQREYDLIISDLQMPNLDGPGLHEALRERYGQALPRVIFVTGHSEADAFVPFLAQTGDPVLTK